MSTTFIAIWLLAAAAVNAVSIAAFSACVIRSIAEGWREP